MVTFRSNNNNRRPPFRSNNNRRPSYRSNNEGPKFSNNDSFQRKLSGRNNHNASKLIEKYNEMAREALANEDRVLSENYFQHADHFTRVQNEQDNIRKARASLTPVEAADSNKTETETETTKVEVKAVKTEEVKEITSDPANKKITKTFEKKAVEKKTATS